MGSWSKKLARLVELSCFADDLDPHQFGFVGQLLDKARMGDVHELLIIALAQLHILLPERVFPDHERADALGSATDR